MATADERRVAHVLIDAIVQAANLLDTLAIRKIVATLRKKATKLEAHTKSKKAQEWRQALSVQEGPRPAGAPGRPSRLAFAWIRGNSGWAQSPLGTIEQEERVPDEFYDEDVPDHIDIDKPVGERIWAKGGEVNMVLSDQADVEQEADVWAKHWDEGSGCSAHCQPPLDEPLKPLMPLALRTAALSFSAGTGVGADNSAPRAVARLSDDLIKALCGILMSIELLGVWPRSIWLVLIVLLPKADGGRRPIGLFPQLVRLWGRARAIVARQWEAAQARPYLFGGAGKGAQRAAWQVAFKAETAALKTHSYAESLLDLIKAFERVPHHLLVRAARQQGYSLWLLRLSLSSYRLRRSIGVDAVYSRLVLAACGITAGSTFATSELRLLLIGAIDMVISVWCTVEVFVYVDDMTLAATGSWTSAEALVAGATDMLVGILENDLHLAVSLTKSLAVGSSLKVAKRVQQISVTGKVVATKAAKLLGTPSGGGKRRAIGASKLRVRKFVAKVKRVQEVHKAGASAKLVVRAAGTPAITYGVEVMGMSDCHLQSARVAIATAVAPAAGGKNPDCILLAADAQGGTLDPAFDAHVLLVKVWAMAYWQHWQAWTVLDDAFYKAVASLQTVVRTPWDKVTGPVSALVASIWRLGWTVLRPTCFRDDRGELVDIIAESPARVAMVTKCSVRRWQLARVARAHPCMVPARLDYSDGWHNGRPVVAGGASDGCSNSSASSSGRCGLLEVPHPFDPPHCVRQSVYTARLPQSVIDLTDVIGKMTFGKRCKARAYPTWDPSMRPWLISAFSGGQWPQCRVAQLSEDGAPTECQICGQGLGNLMHRFECRALMPEAGWPQPSAAVDKFLTALDRDRRELLFTRGLLVVSMELPLRSEDGWWRWPMPLPPEVPDDAVWYIDGSLLDGPRDVLSRCGSAVVVVSQTGALLAYGLGVPPSWVRSASMAELWAFLMVLRVTPAMPMVITDCLNIPQTLARGLDAACGPTRPQARLWRLVGHNLDFHCPPELVEQRLLWMPSHTTRATLGTTQRSDGRPVTLRDWRSNRLADGLAKLAVHTQRLQQGTRDYLRIARERRWSTAPDAWATPH